MNGYEATIKLLRERDWGSRFARKCLEAREPFVSKGIACERGVVSRLRSMAATYGLLVMEEEESPIRFHVVDREGMEKALAAIESGMVDLSEVDEVRVEGIIRRFCRLLDVPVCGDPEYKVRQVPSELGAEICESQDGECYLCLDRTTAWLIHHIRPDGESNAENLVMLCRNCHFLVHKLLWRLKGYRRAPRVALYG